MFAERLKEARKAKRYSQAEVSRMLGVTQQAVGKWETGRSTPDPQTVARLAEILDTPAAQGAGCVLRCGPQCVQPLYRVPGPGCGHGARRVRCAGL